MGTTNCTVAWKALLYLVNAPSVDGSCGATLAAKALPMATPLSAYLSLLGFTVLVESAVYLPSREHERTAWFLRAFTVILVNLITHPAIRIELPRVAERAGWSVANAVLIGFVFSVAMEAVIWTAVTRETPGSSWGRSLLANLLSGSIVMLAPAFGAGLS